MLLVTGGGDRRGFGNLMFLGGLPSFGGSFVFLDMGSSFFFPCIPSFFGCFDLFMIGRVSSLTKLRIGLKKKPEKV